ncbi:MAG: hypothetical protein USCAAHI_01027 [Beijerinckiaceae bacterium]|jgi:hypothetical protein|nr:MAG: hypothetical protein USCAAHI_01027 [Beijerinckiaceae bacterium]
MQITTIGIDLATDWLERRRALMHEWADFVAGSYQASTSPYEMVI